MPTPDPLKLALWCSAAFLSGSIPFGLLLVKLAGKGDVRAHGSGNIGATNVSRVGGKGLGLLVLALDITKGVLPVFLVRRAGFDAPMDAWVALAAVVGHMYTPWLKGKGGKGVATALGVLVVLNWHMVMAPLALFLLVLWLTRHVSLGSILAAALVPLQALPVALVMGFSLPDLLRTLPVLLVCCLVIFKHRENIARLQQGTESKLWGGQKGAAPDA